MQKMGDLWRVGAPGLMDLVLILYVGFNPGNNVQNTIPSPGGVLLVWWDCYRENAWWQGHVSRNMTPSCTYNGWWVPIALVEIISGLYILLVGRNSLHLGVKGCWWWIWFYVFGLGRILLILFRCIFCIAGIGVVFSGYMGESICSVRIVLGCFKISIL